MDCDIPALVDLAEVAMHDGMAALYVRAGERPLLDIARVSMLLLVS